MTKTLLAIAILINCTNFISAQTIKEKIPEAKTKIEQFSASTGVVIIQCFHKIGSEKGMYSTLIDLECKEFINASNGTKQYGITIEAIDNTEPRYKKTHVSYIDYDEIDSLVSGIDYVSKIKSDITKLEDFQADYKTKGDLKISTYSYNGQIQAAITSGSYGGVCATFKLESLANVKALIIKAKEKIDEIKK